MVFIIEVVINSQYNIVGRQFKTPTNYNLKRKHTSLTESIKTECYYLCKGRTHAVRFYSCTYEVATECMCVCCKYDFFLLEIVCNSEFLSCTLV